MAPPVVYFLFRCSIFMSSTLTFQVMWYAKCLVTVNKHLFYPKIICIMSYSCNRGSSWQDYISSLHSSGIVLKAAIFGLQKRRKYAASSDFNLYPVEIKTLINSFTEPEMLYTHGIMLEDEKYTCVRHDSTTIQGKRSTGGCCIVKTKDLLLITVHPESQGYNCLNLTTKLANFFTANKY